MANIQVMVHFDKELLTKIDDEVIKQGKNRTSGRMFDRSAYINFALSEYLKLPIITRGLISTTHNDFQKVK